MFETEEQARAAAPPVGGRHGGVTITGVQFGEVARQRLSAEGARARPRTTVGRVSAPRYRCDGCGNLTRFDVTISQKTKAFHHYSVGGDLVVEDEEVLARNVDEVVCRWCGHGRSVVEITGEELEEPGAPSKVP